MCAINPSNRRGGVRTHDFGLDAQGIEFLLVVPPGLGGIVRYEYDVLVCPEIRPPREMSEIEWLLIHCCSLPLLFVCPVHTGRKQDRIGGREGRSIGLG